MSPIAILIGIVVFLFAGFIAYRLLRKPPSNGGTGIGGAGGSSRGDRLPPNKY